MSRSHIYICNKCPTGQIDLIRTDLQLHWRGRARAGIRGNIRPCISSVGMLGRKRFVYVSCNFASNHS